MEKREVYLYVFAKVANDIHVYKNVLVPASKYLH